MTELLIKTIIGQARQLQRMDTQACADLDLKANIDELLERNADLQAAANKPHLEPSWQAAQMYKAELTTSENYAKDLEQEIQDLRLKVQSYNPNEFMVQRTEEEQIAYDDYPEEGQE